jgi:hypothetical protein
MASQDDTVVEAPQSYAANGESDDMRYCLTVDRKHLTQALRQITRFRKRAGKREMMMLSFADGLLRFSMANVSVGIAAEGTWPTDVLAAAASIYGLSRVPLAEDTVRITLEEDRLKIGSSVMRVDRAGDGAP